MHPDGPPAARGPLTVAPDGGYPPAPRTGAFPHHLGSPMGTAWQDFVMRGGRPPGLHAIVVHTRQSLMALANRNELK